MISLIHSLYCCYSISAHSFHDCIEAGREIRLPWPLKRFLCLVSPARGNESNAKSCRFRPNWNLKGTIYHCSGILRRFRVVSNSAKRDANGFFKVSFWLRSQIDLVFIRAEWERSHFFEIDLGSIQPGSLQEVVWDRSKIDPRFSVLSDNANTSWKRSSLVAFPH